MQSVSSFVAVLAALGAGCSDWTPIRSARDVEGLRVKVETQSHPIVIDEAVVCDNEGYVIARRDVDCREGPPLTFDVRRDKVSVHSGDGKATVNLIVMGVLAAILVPAAIVGSIYLTGGL